jgi:hypothetical protein
MTVEPIFQRILGRVEYLDISSNITTQQNREYIIIIIITTEAGPFF